MKREKDGKAIQTKKEIESFFFDSYAIIEILNGNICYQKYSHFEVSLTIFNLAEIYWHSIRNYSENEADEIYQKYKEALVEIDDEILKESIKFRNENKKKKLSYADCIGYIYAKKHNMKFLTGDKEFENIKNVEFVK
tara:strand:- start:656 stop:1066 length:411 start_codon:yes stop_codon:yes gene_type:complete